MKNLIQALNTAINREQTNLVTENFVVANIPAPQKCGTLTQCSSYNSLLAYKVGNQVENWFNENPHSILFDCEAQLTY